MRKFINIKDLKKIGGGNCGSVFKIDDNLLVKVLKKETPYEKIENEFNNFKNAYKAGLNTSNVYEIVDTEEGTGFTFDYLKGETIINHITKKPYKFIHFLKLYAKTIKEMHNVKVKKEDFKSAKEFYSNTQDESDTNEILKKLYILLEWIPERNSFIHGDCNKNNFLFTEKEGFVIDLAEAYYGNPLFDLLAIRFMMIEEIDIKFLFKDKYKDDKNANDVIKHIRDVPDLIRNKTLRKIIWSIFLSTYLNTNIFSNKYKKANLIILTYSKIGFFTLMKFFRKFLDVSLLEEKRKEYTKCILDAYEMGRNELWGNFDFV